MSELPHQTDEFIEILSPLLKEKEGAAFPNEELSPQRTQDILSLLLEENARLRALTVTLSNLLGDLPVPEWEHAMAAPARRPDGARSGIDRAPAACAHLRPGSNDCLSGKSPPVGQDPVKASPSR